MGIWVHMFAAVGKRWWSLMSCAAITFLGAVVVHFRWDVKLSEYLLGALSVFFLLLATMLEWADECKKRVAVEEDRRQQINVRDKEIEQLVNDKRPEVFVSYSTPAVFFEMLADSWHPDLVLRCRHAVSLRNSGKSAAFDVRVHVLLCKAFTIEFAGLPRLDAETDETVEAHLFPHPVMSFDKGRHCLVDEPDGAGSFAYEGIEDEGKKVAKLETGASLKVSWRDSNDRYFFSTFKGGMWSSVRRMETPVTEEDIRGACADEEVTQ